jgi:tetratricopeptide (TPR) repeat protein
LVRARWIQAGLAIIAVVVILAALGVFAPREMKGLFNVAVADFGEMDSNGGIHSSKAGELMSGWTVNYLRNELKKVDLNIDIWPNEGNMLTRTKVPLVQPDTAEKTASDINADLLLYGYIDTSTNPSQLMLNFWVAPQDKYKFEDIQGNTQIGAPIRVVDLNDPGISVQSELESQSTAVAFIAMGLAQEQLGQSEDALAAFLKAEEAAPQSEIVQFFIGREYLFLAEFKPDQQDELWQKAEDAYLKSIALNDQYAKAYLGLGSVYLKRSAELLNATIASKQTFDPQALQFAEQAIEAFQKVLDLKLDRGQIGNQDQNLARLALGNAYQQKGAILYTKGDFESALNALAGAINILESAQKSFEASIPEHESYRRYLVQSHEYLGTAYEWQGRTFEAKQDFDAALPAYQKSIDAFNQCIANGKDSPDLIIQNDIIGKYCQPKLEEVQKIYDELTGGN